MIVHFQIIPTFSFVLLLLLSPALEPGITSTYVSASFECAFKVTAYLSSQEPTERNHPIPFLLLLPARWRHESTHCLDMDSPWITALLSLRFLYWIKSVGISCHTPFCFHWLHVTHGSIKGHVVFCFWTLSSISHILQRNVLHISSKDIWQSINTWSLLSYAQWAILFCPCKINPLSMKSQCNNSLLKAS